TAADGVRLALRVILQSPNFLYRSESGAPIGGDGGAARPSPGRSPRSCRNSVLGQHARRDPSTRSSPE
ncbi:MAG: DUF1595 domain-containing protein, partial [Polyangiaceae bacterium]|nr:DUF1595 domain-containing protein [Polyangiaceae bacterium]